MKIINEHVFKNQQSVRHQNPIYDEITETNKKTEKIDNQMKHKIICGECIEVMKEMESKSIDLVVTDPPYGIGYYSNHYKHKNPHKKIINDNQLFLPIDNIRHIIKETGAIFFFFSWKNPPQFHLKNKIIWVKNNWSAGDLEGDFGNQYEEIGFISANKFKLKSKRFSNVWFYDRQRPELHPTQKPIALIAKMILSCTYKNEIVLDPFLGSGTTSIAAERLGRNSIGIEISKEYCELSYQRLLKEVQQQKWNQELSTIEKIGF